jgi:hypothetical protein
VSDRDRLRRCERCGSPIQRDEAFCGVCGTRVSPTVGMPGRSSHGASAPSRRNGAALAGVVIVGVLIVTLVSTLTLVYTVFAPGMGESGSSERQTNNEPLPTNEQKDDSVRRESTGGTASTRSSASSIPQSDAELEEELRQEVQSYYRAVDLGNWDYTYGELDSQTKQRFTKSEWILKNQYFADVDPLERSIPEITSEVSTSFPVEVTLTQIFRSGITRSRITYFVWEGGSWKHRFSQEEYDLFMAEASYEEFV